MFHVKHALHRLATAIGSPLSDTQWDLFEAYARWLADEAAPAGGIGPGEAERLGDRHIGDSLAFALAFPERPARLTDVGSGAGLPGIPLAILWSETRVDLMDRSQRRVELCERAIRVLGLANVSVDQRDVADETRTLDAIVTRAVFPPDQWISVVRRRLAPDGRAVTTLGSLEAPTAAPPGYDLEVIAVPETLLDHPVRLLMMTRKLQG